MTPSGRRLTLAALVLAPLAVATAAALWPGAGARVALAGALTVLTIGLWASAALPEHLTALAFFVLATLLAVAPESVVFSGFASSALWLVFGGLVLGVAVQRTGLGGWLAAAIVHRIGGTYPRVVVAVVIGNVLLGFLVPSAMARAVILMPIVLALAERLGFGPGHAGRTGMVVATAVGGFTVPATILPANLPNAVLLGAADTLYGISITYGEYLLMHFPVNGVLKAALVVVLVWWLFPAEVRVAPTRRAQPGSLGRDGRRLLAVLCIALALWITDRWHGIAPGWVSAAAALYCLLPGVNLVPAESFHRDVSFATVLYVAGILGLGAVVADSGLGEVFARLALDVVPLDPATPAYDFAVLSALATLLGLFATMPGIVAILAPLGMDMASASGLSLLTVLMTTVNGYSNPLFPYQAGPIVFALRLGGESIAAATRLTLPLAAIAAVVLLPLTYLWWAVLGYLP